MFRIQTTQRTQNGLGVGNFMVPRFETLQGDGFTQLKLYSSMNSPLPSITLLVRYDMVHQARVIIDGDVVEEYNAAPPAPPAQATEPPNQDQTEG